MGWLAAFKRSFRGSDTQASLFNYVKPEEAEASRFSWRELLDLIKPDLRQPDTQASLFRYLKPKETESESREIQLSPEVLAALASRAGEFEPDLIGSLFSDVSEAGREALELRRRRRITAIFSLAFHAGFAGLMIFLMLGGMSEEPIVEQTKQDVTFLISPPPMFYQGSGRDGGGGGGGGKREPTPPSPGRLPKTSNIQLVPPDPKPMEVSSDAFFAEQSVIVPIEIPQNQALPIGDITAPPSEIASSGPGSGGGIGTGRGTGIGSGRGPGVGPGGGGGMGGGYGGGIGSGVGPYIAGTAGIRDPEPIYTPTPNYTEEARRAKIEGIVLIQVVIRRDGSVDNPRVLRGLGYGLDESAVQTIVTKWKFKPGLKDGQPVDVIANIEVTFRLL